MHRLEWREWGLKIILAVDAAIFQDKFNIIIYSLAPDKMEWNFRYVFFKRTLVIVVEASLVKLP